MNATATASAGRTITSVAFQISPAGKNTWTTIDTQTSGPRYSSTLDTTNKSLVPQNGLYDIRALATDSAGEQADAVAPDRVVANDQTFIWPNDPGTPLHGTVTLSGGTESAQPDTMTFEVSPAGADNFKPVGTVGLDQQSFEYLLNLDTTTLADGEYDIRVTAPPDSFGDTFIGGVVRRRLIDNTPPTSTLSNPGGQLNGVVTLTAAAQDAGSGVGAVKFERAPAGSGAWTTIAVATRPPYSAAFDTAQVADGSYDLRVEAVDKAGNSAASPVVSRVTVSNPSAQRFGNFTITNYAVPASKVSLLGEIAGSPQHETWAYGTTNAPPPVVDGAPLPFTASGAGQLVLLRYTDDGGWQVADVLRNPDGSAYQQVAGAATSVAGRMTSTGEAWIVLRQQVHGQPPQLAVFHRAPGGRFSFDQSASGVLAQVIGSNTQPVQLRLGQTAGGSPYGLLLAPEQPAQSTSVTTPNGPVTISTRLNYGVLADGAWTRQTASLPSSYVPSANDDVALAAADATGPGAGWGALSVTSQSQQQPLPLMLAKFDPGGWHYVTTQLDALDLTDAFAASPAINVRPNNLHADSGGVWIGATVSSQDSSGTVIARYDDAAGQVVDSWCGPAVPRASIDCGQVLDLGHPAAVPDAAFDTSSGIVNLAASAGFVYIYAHGAWTPVPAPGYGFGPDPGKALFAAPDDGWVVGQNAIGRITAQAPPSPLASWPEANRSPLTSVALPPGRSDTNTAGSLAVGLDGTALHYDPAAGWLVDPTPPRAHRIALESVAFSGPSSAFAVGQLGTILRWDGASWSSDPQSVSATTSTLNSVAFGADGQGWAVGAFGTILHYDGSSWSPEQVDAADAGTNLTSVAVAGSDVFAVANGNLITRDPAGVWRRVGSSSLPTPAPPGGALRLVAGLPDGGLVAAGRSIMLARQSSGSAFQYAGQPFEGTAIALAPFRDSGGNLRTFMSVAPPIHDISGQTHDLGGLPPGDGELLQQTAAGWQDLSRAIFPGGTTGGDGAVKADPVLAVAASPDGNSSWAVGGYAGTHDAAGLGTDEVLSARPFGWRTSAIWRYDAGGSATSPEVSQGTVDLPTNPNTVSFAFFSSALCKVQCAAVRDAQPDVNLRSAASQIAAFAQQPGGPAFAMLGGNARGPATFEDWKAGNGAVDMARLPDLLAPLGGLPLFAAYGPRDAVPTSAHPAAPWAEAFAGAPAPFGPAQAPSGISPISAGEPTGSVHRYYAFDASQNGGTLRVIVLDNAAGSLEDSAPGQTAWLDARLAQAQADGIPVVVVTAEPLRSSAPGGASDGDAIAAKLAAAGVLGVFTTSGANFEPLQQPNQQTQIPENANPGDPQIPEYEGATLTYQQPKNNGVVWYDVSVDTQAQTLSVKAIPVISSLALEPLNGLSVARSSTLSFQAVGRRPPASLATPFSDPSFPGYDSYVGIPSSPCAGCIGPSYAFKSSNRIVGDFVAASGPGSLYPKLDSQGHPIRSSTSGLFCAFNAGTTTVSVTSGLLTSSLPVTVQAGGFGPPCGTVPGGVNANVIRLPGRVIARNPLSPGLGLPLKPTAAQPSPTKLPSTVLPPAPAVKPAPVPQPAPAPHAAPRFQPALVQQSPALGVPPLVVPLIPPAITPVPPGGATVSAQAAAKREEKARKHASQSAFVTRPAGTSASDWFYPAVGVVSLLAALLIAGGMRPGPRPKLALLEARETDYRRRRSGR